MFGLFVATPNKFVEGKTFVYLKQVFSTLEEARTAANTMKIGEGKRLYVAELNWLPIEEEPKFEGNVVAFRKRA